MTTKDKSTIQTAELVPVIIEDDVIWGGTTYLCDRTRIYNKDGNLIASPNGTRVEVPIALAKALGQF